MFTILANAAPDSQSLGEFIKVLVWCLVALAAIIGLILSLYRTVFNPPFARKAEVEKLAEEFNIRQAAATASRKKIYEKVEHIDTRLATAEAQNVAQDDKVALLSADFRAFAKEQRGVNTEQRATSLEILKELQRKK